MQPKDKFYIGITGGACSGKTTGLVIAKQKLEDLGYLVVVVPEAATACINAGLRPWDKYVEPLDFQVAIGKMIIGYEDPIRNLANQVFERSRGYYKGLIVLFDRGFMDGKAYIDDMGFAEVLSANGLTEVYARDKRYDAVIHLVTTAIGAESFYTLKNNTARSEDLTEARALDGRTKKAWLGHEHLRVIDNSTDFEGKMRRCMAEVFSIIGIPVPIEHERKFLVRQMTNLPVDFRTVKISQSYLPNGDRIRQRGVDGSFCYYLTSKAPSENPAKRVEIQRMIDFREYKKLYDERDQSLATIDKSRSCFLSDDQYFEYDLFRQHNAIDPDCALLEIELTGEKKEVIIPSFFDVVKEVTGDPAYSNYEIARRLGEK